MTERVGDSAAAATGGDADPGEGAGLSAPGAHAGGGAGSSGDMAVPGDERAQGSETTTEVDEGMTEGERSVLRSAAQRTADPDLSGLDPDDVPDEGPDAGHRFPDPDPSRPSRGDVPDAAPGAGSAGSRSGGQGSTGSDAAQNLG